MRAAISLVTHLSYLGVLVALAIAIYGLIKQKRQLAVGSLLVVPVLLVLALFLGLLHGLVERSEHKQIPGAAISKPITRL